MSGTSIFQGKDNVNILDCPFKDKDSSACKAFDKNKKITENLNEQYIDYEGLKQKVLLNKPYNCDGQDSGQSICKLLNGYKGTLDGIQTIEYQASIDCFGEDKSSATCKQLTDPLNALREAILKEANPQNGGDGKTPQDDSKSSGWHALIPVGALLGLLWAKSR